MTEREDYLTYDQIAEIYEVTKEQAYFDVLQGIRNYSVMPEELETDHHGTYEPLLLKETAERLFGDTDSRKSKTWLTYLDIENIYGIPKHQAIDMIIKKYVEYKLTPENVGLNADNSKVIIRKDIAEQIFGGKGNE